MFTFYSIVHRCMVESRAAEDNLNTKKRSGDLFSIIVDNIYNYRYDDFTFANVACKNIANTITINQLTILFLICRLIFGRFIPVRRNHEYFEIFDRNIDKQ